MRDGLQRRQRDGLLKTDFKRELGTVSYHVPCHSRVQNVGRKTEAMLKEKHKDSLLAALPSASFRIALVDLANAGDISFDKVDFAAEIKEASVILDALDSITDPFLTRRGDFKKAYRSRVDNSFQPYRIFVPSSYNSSKSSALIIALHGMGGDENSYFDAYAQGAFKIEAERRGYIVACPKGRKPGRPAGVRSTAKASSSISLDDIKAVKECIQTAAQKQQAKVQDVLTPKPSVAPEAPTPLAANDPDIPEGTEMVTMTMREALRDAMSEEMRRDKDVFVMGEEVAEYQGAYKVTQGLLQEFGPKRVIDTYRLDVAVEENRTMSSPTAHVSRTDAEAPGDMSTAREGRWGSREAEITGVEMIGASGQPCTEPPNQGTSQGISHHVLPHQGC